MRWSRLFIPTLREDPADAESVSQRLLLRAGYIRPLAPGLYTYLFPARRSLTKIVAIVRQEMEAIGAQEVFVPCLQPAELLQESGGWESGQDTMFRLTDRNGRSLGLAMGAEEAVTTLARGELRSYKQLPQIWCQLQPKFRDEPHPRAGLLHMRQFLTLDSYSFDEDAAGMETAYRSHYSAFSRILDRCGLGCDVIGAGSGSHRLVVRSATGDEAIAECPHCGTVRALDEVVSTPVPPAAADPPGDFAPEEFHTPGRKTIAEVARFTGLPETAQMKSLVLVADGKTVLALVRGDHQLSEAKLAAALSAREVRPAEPDEIRRTFGADAGSLGPIGVPNLRILADLALEGRRNMIAGANRDDYHLRNVTPGKDFATEFRDLRRAAPGDACAQCGQALAFANAIEVARLTCVATRYSEALGLRVLNQAGREIAPAMGSYRLGIERVLGAAVETHNDAQGMALPVAIAPFQVVVTPVNMADSGQATAAETLHRDLNAAGIDTLLDDRDERPGVKFKDAELIGIPFRVTVGKKLAQGKVELVDRSSKLPVDVPLADAVGTVTTSIHEAMRAEPRP